MHSYNRCQSVGNVYFLASCVFFLLFRSILYFLEKCCRTDLFFDTININWIALHCIYCSFGAVRLLLICVCNAQCESIPQSLSCSHFKFFIFMYQPLFYSNASNYFLRSFFLVFTHIHKIHVSSLNDHIIQIYLANNKSFHTSICIVRVAACAHDQAHLPAFVWCGNVLKRRKSD